MKISFGSNEQQKIAKYIQNTPRELFYYLINIDEFFSVLPTAKHFVDQQLKVISEAEIGLDHFTFFPYKREVFTEYCDSLLQQKTCSLAEIQYTQEQLLYLLRQQAPTALTDGSWLQNISLSATCHTVVATEMFDLYTKKVGNGKRNHNYTNLYRDVLQSAQIYMPDINSWCFVAQPEILNSAFVKPVFQMSLSQFPRTFLPEIIGYNLGHFYLDYDRPQIYSLGNTEKFHINTRYFELYGRQNRRQLCEIARNVVVDYLEEIADTATQQQLWQRIWNGFAANYVLIQEWQQQIREYLEQNPKATAHEKMVAMIRKKAPYARGLHKYARIGGKPLNDWFSGEVDAQAFLSALASSRFIDIENPQNSKFITQLIQFGGPMFRVFTRTEVETIIEWIEGLKNQSTLSGDIAEVEETRLPKSPSVESPNMEHEDLQHYRKSNERDLYYYFVNIDLFPDALPVAKQTAIKYLAQTKAFLRKKLGVPKLWKDFYYTHEAFEERILTIYEKQVNDYKAFEKPSLTKKSLTWFIQQFAPFALVDGCWLQSIAKVGISQTEVSARLFHIYSDEIGNADIEWNHPNVYRRLLESVELHLPATDSKDFPYAPGFITESFHIPNLLLSASMFPKTFLPEIIGINLGIELSGLGEEYMSMIDEMKYWKVDPYFFTLHLTIDNMASGHAAVAMETVQIYLDQILSTGGQEMMQQHWQRIWRGYVAFSWLNKRLMDAVKWNVLTKFMIPDAFRKVFRKS